jgi:succinate dehydrogenase/fumarate reductase flavoprotein subunit
MLLGKTEMIVAVADVESWSGSAELIVVGYGIAGVCAAIEARELGAPVLVLERASGCSGSTVASGGMLYLGGGTAVQKACGFDDTPEAMATYLTAAATHADSKAKIARLSAGSVAHFDWLEARGVPFRRSYYPQKNLVPPGPECLMYSGNEKVWPFREVTPPAPRGHKVAFDGLDGGGSVVLEKLVDHAGRIGVDVRFDMHVNALVMHHERVVGVGVRHFGETLYFRAERGVALCGGGFGRNEAMMARYAQRLAAGATIVGGPYDDGTAITLGMEAGGTVEHMDGVLLVCSIYPPEQLTKGIIVNSAGKRIVAEDSYHGTVAHAVSDQPDGIAYLIVDSDIFAYPDWYEHANQRLVDGYGTIAEMEQGLELPEGTLAATMDAYNRHAAAGEDPDFHKHPDWLKPLDAGPWAAFDISFGRANYFGFTLGGLKISPDGEVLREDGSPVPGLYAAGASASTIAQDSRSYLSGISLAAGSFFGRAAGRHAVTSRPLVESA